MGKFDWLKNALIKEEEPSVAQNPNVNNSNVNNSQFQARFVQPTVSQPVMTQPVMTQSSDTTPDQAYLDHLYKFMEEQNIPGPDYFEFANTLHEMSQMAGGIPEANLYQLAYVGLKAQGVTPAQLTQTASKYIGLFDKHKQEFENVLSQEIQKSINSKTQEIQNLEQNNASAEAKINDITQQIQTLQQQMVANAQKIAENNIFIQTESQKVTIKKSKFENAYKIVVEKVNGDIQKIQNYVK